MFESSLFESSLAVPFHFTIEFLGFVIAAGAVLLVPSRPQLVPGLLAARLTVAAGFALLAARQLIHGATFVEADGNQRLVMLTAAGYVLIAAGVAGGLGRTWSVGAALSVGRPELLAPAGAALVMTLAAAASARRGAEALYRLALAGVLLAGSAILVAAAPDDVIGATPPDPLGYAAHGLRFLGYLALAWWLWAGVKASIRSRFVAAYAGLLVVVVLALSSTLTAVITSNVKREELKRAETQLANAVGDVGGSVTTTLNDVLIIRNTSTVRERLASKDNLSGLAANLADNPVFDLDFAVLTGPKGDILSHDGSGPAVFDREGEAAPTRLRPTDLLEIIGSQPADEVISARSDVAAGLIRVGGDSVAIVSAGEVTDPRPGSPRRVGIVLAGNFIDALTVERLSNSFEPASASFAIGRRVFVSDLPRAVPRDGLVAADLRSSLDIDPFQSMEQTLGRFSYFSAFAPLQSNVGETVAVLALSTPAEIIDETRAGVIRSLFLVALGVGAVALLLAWLSGRRITGPIKSLTATATAIREGDLESRAEVSGEDEVGQLGATFNEMTAALIGLTVDLSESALQEKELRDRIETIIQSMADGLVAIDASRNVLAFNAQAELLTGIDSRSAIGMQVSDVLDVRDSQGERVTLPIHELSEGSVGNVFMVPRSGSATPVAVTSAVLRNEGGEVTGGVAVVRDVSREHEMETMKSEFLSNISHELRTPLTPIRGYAELLGEPDVPPDEVKRFGGGILESTERLERIVGLLVDFSAMETGRLAPRSTPVDLSGLIKGLAGEWGARSPRHDVVAEVDTSLPQVMGDERLLKRSFAEILDNAVKFSPHGGTIRLRAYPISGNGLLAPDSVEIVVSDEGIGISNEDLPKIFSDFRQLDGSATRTYGGLGLGLTFVHRIVEAHNGKIRVESEQSRGTRLTISLPVVAEEDVG